MPKAAEHVEYMIQYAIFMDMFAWFIHGEWASDGEEYTQFITNECNEHPDYEELGIGG